MEIEDQIMKLIISRKKGILQNELWKKVEIDRRKCSRIIEKLEKEGKIIREEETDKSVRTYRIKSVEVKEKKVKDFKLLMVGEIFEPCTGCSFECIPEHCLMLKDWINCLVDLE